MKPEKWKFIRKKYSALWKGLQTLGRSNLQIIFFVFRLYNRFLVYIPSWAFFSISSVSTVLLFEQIERSYKNTALKSTSICVHNLLFRLYLRIVFCMFLWGFCFFVRFFCALNSWINICLFAVCNITPKWNGCFFYLILNGVCLQPVFGTYTQYYGLIMNMWIEKSPNSNKGLFFYFCGEKTVTFV